MGIYLRLAVYYSFILFAVTSCGEMGLISPESSQGSGSASSAPLGDSSGPGFGTMCPPDEVCEGDQRVFVTSTIFPNGNLGGLAGADAQCLLAAQNAGIEANYKAILSAGGGQTASNRLNFTGGAIYKKTTTQDKVVVARNEAALWNTLNSPLESSIRHDEAGNLIAGNTAVFTGTNATGDISGQTCLGWTSAGVLEFNIRGDALQVGQTWISSMVAMACDKPARLYCLEQP